MIDERPQGIYGDVINWIHRLFGTFGELVAIVDSWYSRRRPLTRNILGVIGGVLLSILVTSVDWTRLSAAISLDTNQLLIVLIGVAMGQTLVQTRTFNRVGDAVTHVMESTDTRTDGGNRTREESGSPFAKPRTTGGGAIGGAIIGAGIGSSFGPGGTVAGVVIGAVLGDNFEELYL